MLAQGFQCHRKTHRLAVTQNVEHDLRSRLLLCNQHLKFAGVTYFLVINFGDHIANLQAGFSSRRIGFDLRNHSPVSGVVEEFRVLRRHVRDSDSDVAMADFAVANQRFHSRPDDLAWESQIPSPRKSPKVKPEKY